MKGEEGGENIRGGDKKTQKENNQAMKVKKNNFKNYTFLFRIRILSVFFCLITLHLKIKSETNIHHQKLQKKRRI